jgi:DEAD/DEAH box helicase domain-containing protein
MTTLSVRVRSLTGAEAVVELSESATVSDLRKALRRRDGFGRSVSLFVCGRRLADGGAALAPLLQTLPGGKNAFVVSSTLWLTRSLSGSWTPFVSRELQRPLSPPKKQPQTALVSGGGGGSSGPPPPPAPASTSAPADSPTPQPYGSRRVAAIAAAAAADLGAPVRPTENEEEQQQEDPAAAAAAAAGVAPLLVVDPLGNPGYSSRPNPSPRGRAGGAASRPLALALAEAEEAIEAGAALRTGRGGGGSKRARPAAAAPGDDGDDDEQHLPSPATRRLQRRARQQQQQHEGDAAPRPPPQHQQQQQQQLPLLLRAALPPSSSSSGTGLLTQDEAAALEALPLPAALLSLSRAFAALNAFVAFLQAENVTPTLRNVREHVGRALRSAAPPDGDNEPRPAITPLSALRALAALAPRVVALSDRDAAFRDLPPELREQYIGGGRGGQAGGGGGFFASAAEQAAAEMLGADAGRGREDDEEADLDATVDLLDPGRRGKGSSVAKRREAAVRRALAAAALAAHERFLDEREEEDGGAAAGRWDALSRGAWHPAWLAAGDRMPLQQLVGLALDARGRAQEALAAAAGTEQQDDDDDRSSSDDEEDDDDHTAAAARRRRPPPRPPVLSKRHPPCLDTSPLSPQAFLDHLRRLSWYDGQIAHIEPVPGRAAATAAPSFPMSPPSLAALRWRFGDGAGASTSSPQQQQQQQPLLYRHQAQAVDAVLLRKRHAVVATATASGKSLCYMLPLVEMLASDPQATAVLMFPTKALAHDQLRALRGFLGAAFSEGEAERWVRTYDGDTPRMVGGRGGGEGEEDGGGGEGGGSSAEGERAAVRREARVLLTNPDMLHASVLPYHASFARFLSGLSLVVVDEGHAYSGVFGTHASLVLRRLRRVVERAYRGGGCGNDNDGGPRFVVTSATIANPLGHAAALIGVGPPEIELVDADGSPSGPKQFVLWNPPLEQPLQQQQQEGEGGKEGAQAAAAGQGRGRTAAAERELARWARREEPAARRAAVEAAMARAVAEGGGREEEDDDDGAGEDDEERNVMWRARRLAARRARAARESDLDLLPEGPLDLGRRRSASPPPSPPPPPRPQPQQHQAPSPRYLAPAPRAAAAPDSLPSSPAAARPSLAVPAHADPALRRRLLAEQAHAAIAAAAGGGGGAIPLRPLPPRAEQADEAGLARDRPLWRVRPGGANLSGSGGRGRQPPASDADAQAAIVAALPPRGAFAAEWRAKCGAAANGPAAAATAAAPPPQQQPPSASMLVPDARRHPAALSGLQLRRGAAGTLERQARASPIVETARLLAELAQHGLRAIAFCKSRKLCELVATYARDILRATAAARAEEVAAGGGGGGGGRRRGNDNGSAAALAPSSSSSSLAFAAPHGDRPSGSLAFEALASRVAVYRAGYAPAQRRALERALHSGSLLAVAATNALELGVDVGDLDATLHLGFPGSVASLRQQAGRAGRRGQPSLALYVAFDSPLDQQLLRHPRRALFGRSVEAARVDPCNAMLLRQHLACAAAELPIVAEQDARLFSRGGGGGGDGSNSSAFAGACASLLADGLVARHPRLALQGDGGNGHGGGASGSSVAAPPPHPHPPLHYAGGLENPARSVSLRCVDQRRVAVWDESTKRVLEELEASKAFFHVYDGAVYMHQARTYLCRRLDLVSGVALVVSFGGFFFFRHFFLRALRDQSGCATHPLTLVSPSCPPNPKQQQ